MLNRIERWREAGHLSDVDAGFGYLIHGLGGGVPEVTLGACLASRATDAGHVCLDLRRHAGRPVFPGEDDSGTVAPPLDRWIERLGGSPAVGAPGDWRPLLLDPCGRLYLYRYWNDERILAEDLMARAVRLDEEERDDAAASRVLDRLFPAVSGVDTDWQKIAAAASLTRRLCVISGGPGTGKTTTVSRLLAMLIELSGSGVPRIALAAPTGKAAARLTDSMQAARRGLDTDADTLAAMPRGAVTIHRLLGVRPGGTGFVHYADNPLPLDVLVLDEASMVDLSLMARVVEALPGGARLILLGDRDQLASVEAGSVLGDICARAGQVPWSARQVRDLSGLTGEDPGAGGADTGGIADSIVLLRHSYRFSAGGGIGRLAAAVNAGRPAAAIGAAEEHSEVCRIDHHSQREPVPDEDYVEAFGDLARETDPARALTRIDAFRILCPLRGGPAGVARVNEAVEAALRRAGLVHGQGEWFCGRPVMVARNDYPLGLFNGDIGICLPDPEDDGALKVWFRSADGDLRPVPPGRMPLHETAWAMTVHKSQGSEFDRVLLVLPDRDHRLLTRELVYTAVTRARRSLEIRGSREVLGAAVSRRIHRESGLAERLWSLTP